MSAELRRADDDRWLHAAREIGELRATTDTLKGEVQLLRETTGEVRVALGQVMRSVETAGKQADALQRVMQAQDRAQALIESHDRDIAAAKAHGMKAVAAVITGGAIALGSVLLWGIKVVWNHDGQRPPIP